MQQTYNGMPAAALTGVLWRKSIHSNSTGNCVELAELPDGAVVSRKGRP